MAGTDPDELERRIESTRADLARTVDAIADRVSPKRVAQRGVAKVRANAEHFVTTIGDTISAPNGSRPAVSGGQSDDLWEDRDPARDLAPVLIGVGVVLVAGAAIMLWRRRRR